ncbi:hypothetical protein Tco_0606267 [Tanacetum coccineum]
MRSVEWNDDEDPEEDPEMFNVEGGILQLMLLLAIDLGSQSVWIPCRFSIPAQCTTTPHVWCDASGFAQGKELERGGLNFHLAFSIFHQSSTLSLLVSPLGLDTRGNMVQKRGRSGGRVSQRVLTRVCSGLDLVTGSGTSYWAAVVSVSQQSEKRLVELTVRGRIRRRLIIELMAADYEDERGQLSNGTLKLCLCFGTTKGPAQPDAPEEAGSSS